jgi:hypothetical protein
MIGDDGRRGAVLVFDSPAPLFPSSSPARPTVGLQLAHGLVLDVGGHALCDLELHLLVLLQRRQEGADGGDGGGGWVGGWRCRQQAGGARGRGRCTQTPSWPQGSDAGGPPWTPLSPHRVGSFSIRSEYFKTCVMYSSNTLGYSAEDSTSRAAMAFCPYFSFSRYSRPWRRGGGAGGWAKGAGGAGPHRGRAACGLRCAGPGTTCPLA